MTFSLLAVDPQTGALGGAAATGSLCVGGWVLRGALDAGMSASQGAAPSTFWGEDVLCAMRAGEPSDTAVAGVTATDTGRDWRQLAALDLTGRGAAFTGPSNTPAMGSVTFEGGIASGNMLADKAVLDAMAKGYRATPGPFAKRLLASLRSADAAGSDARGLLSAALLILHPDSAPLTLRIDHHESDPIGALARLYSRATTGDYAEWSRQVPSRNAPHRILQS